MGWDGTGWETRGGEEEWEECRERKGREVGRGEGR